MIYCGVTVDEILFTVFEGGKVDSGVREHANESHGEATVEGADTGCSPHLDGGGGYERVAVEATFDSFALHTT